MSTVSYGHAHEIAARAAGAPPAVDTPPIDPALYWRDNVRPVLAARDIGVLYLVLKDDAELTQRRIAELTGQSQSEVSEILKGRQVRDVTVLERIAKGLGIPLELMGLSYGEHSAYGEDSTVAEAPDGVDEDMQRRDLIAMSAFATLGFVPFGTLLNPPPGPGVLSLPSQLGMTDVVEIKNTTEQLRSAARARGGQARAVSAAAIEYGRLTQVPAAEPVAARLGSVLADLHTLAGWCCYDSGLSRRARWHYRQAIDYATAAPDDYRLADVLQYVGILERAAGHPNEAVKFYQLAGFHLGAKGDSGLVAWGHGLSALALANLEHPQAAEHLTRAREGWQPSNAFERADMDYQTALVHTELGDLESAERFVVSINGAGRLRPVGTFAEILRATVHVRAGEPRGLALAHGAITAASKLSSMRARQRLEPLATALEGRSGADAHQLARMARQVATTRV